MDLYDIYHEDIPEFIQELANTKAMLRLKGVGMSCGLEYTSFPIYQLESYYSRYEHSIGVALIVYHFTHSIQQAIAGLMHDISTPSFSHVIDFLNHDSETQESTEAYTHEMIASSQEIQDILHRYHLTTEDVDDYHRFPICDNDHFRLSSDRLEYTLGYLFKRKLKTKEEIKQIYDDIIVTTNELGQEELSFADYSIARDFALSTLSNSYFYVTDEDRFSMQYVADMLLYAIDHQIISEKDLYVDEKHVIRLLKLNTKTKKMWEQYTSFSRVQTFDKKQPFYCVKVNTKKRYIDPLWNSQRISKADKEVQQEIQAFLDLSFDCYISEESLIE